MAKQGDNLTQYYLFRGSEGIMPSNPNDVNMAIGMNAADVRDNIREEWNQFIYTQAYSRPHDMVPLPSQQIKFASPDWGRVSDIDLRGQSQDFLRTYHLKK
jgi:hypothetical protein